MTKKLLLNQKKLMKIGIPNTNIKINGIWIENSSELNNSKKSLIRVSVVMFICAVISTTLIIFL